MPDPNPADILAFWKAAGDDKWFKHDPAFDAAIRAHFAATHAAAATGALVAWADTPDGALALVIVLDQFSRNLFRNDARAFTQDADARRIAADAIARGDATHIDPALVQFLYMPFMHSEASADQDRCLALFEALDAETNIKFAKTHRDIIARFGRFPHRNAALGRVTTPEEQTFLDDGGFAG